MHYNWSHDPAESGSGHLIIVDGRLSLICILLVSVDENVHFDGFAASAGCQFLDNQFGLGDQINQHLGLLWWGSCPHLHY